MLNRLSRSPALKFAAGVGAMRIAGLALEFVAWVALARRLELSEFGQLAVAFVVARYGGLIGDWGAGFGGARDVVVRPDTVASLLHRRAAVTVVIAALFALTAVVSGHGELAPLSVVVLARGLNRDWIAIGRNQSLRAGASAVVQGAILVGLSLTVVNHQSQAAWALALAFAVALAVSVGLNRHEGDGRGSHRTGSWTLVLGLASQVILSADTALLALLRDSSEAAIYAAVYRIPTALMTTVGLLAAGLAGAAARSVNQSPEYQATTLQRARAGGVVGVVMVGLLIAPAVMAVVPLFDVRYASGRLPLALLMVSIAISVSAAGLLPIALAKGADRPLAIVAVIAAIVAVIGNLVLIPLYGMVGAAIMAVVSQFLLSAAVWRYSS